MIFPFIQFNQTFDKLYTWNYLGNGILDEIVKNATQKDFKIIERDDAYVMPELNLFKGNPYKSYHYYYFIERDPIPLLNVSLSEAFSLKYSEGRFLIFSHFLKVSFYFWLHGLFVSV